MTLFRRAARAQLALVVVTAACMPAHADTKAVNVTIQGGEAAGGVQAIRLVRNDDVVLTVKTDQADELHLHGYNVHLHLQPGVPGTLRFAATRTGRFSAELHKAGREVVVFEIYPK